MASTVNVNVNVGPRRRAREIALQILHAMDVSPELSADEALRRTFEHVFDAQGQVEEEDAAVIADPVRPSHEADALSAVLRPEIPAAVGALSPAQRLDQHGRGSILTAWIPPAPGA